MAMATSRKRLQHCTVQQSNYTPTRRIPKSLDGAVEDPRPCQELEWNHQHRFSVAFPSALKAATPDFQGVGSEDP